MKKSISFAKCFLLSLLLTSCSIPNEKEEQIKENQRQRNTKIQEKGQICINNNGDFQKTIGEDFSCTQNCTIEQAYQSGFIFQDDYKVKFYRYFDYIQNRWNKLCIPHVGSFVRICKPTKYELASYRMDSIEKIKNMTWTQSTTDGGQTWGVCTYRSSKINEQNYIDDVVPQLYL